MTPPPAIETTQGADPPVLVEDCDAGFPVAIRVPGIGYSVYGIGCARAARAAICSSYGVKGCLMLEFARGIAFSIRRVRPDYGPRATDPAPPHTQPLDPPSPSGR